MVGGVRSSNTGNTEQTSCSSHHMHGTQSVMYLHYCEGSRQPSQLQDLSKVISLLERGCKWKELAHKRDADRQKHSQTPTPKRNQTQREPTTAVTALLNSNRRSEPPQHPPVVQQGQRNHYAGQPRCYTNGQCSNLGQTVLQTDTR